MLPSRFWEIRSTGAILYVLITILGPISGAHFNPAVTLAFLIRREIAAGLALQFVLVQIAGGICGALLAHFMFEMPLLQLSENMRNGPAQWGSEFIATFGLLTVIFGGLRWRPEAVPTLVGLYITAAYWFTSSTSFANQPSLATSFTNSFSGVCPLMRQDSFWRSLLLPCWRRFFLRWLFAGERAD